MIGQPSRGYMSRRVSILLLSVMLAGLLTSPVSATHESICLPHDDEPVVPVEPVELCATTTISGTESGVVGIRIPRDTTLRTNFGAPPPDRDIDVQGSGRVVGIVLLEDRPNRDGARLFQGRLLTEGADRHFAFVQGFTSSGSGYQIPAGDYLLYLVADGEPVNVTLRPSDLVGSIELSPFRPVSSEIRSLTRRTPAQIDHVSAAGDAHEIEDFPGLVLDAVWVHGTDLVASRFGACIFVGEPEDPPGYAPECPGATFRDVDAATGIPGVPPGVAQFSRSLVGITSPAPPGTYGVGAWHETVASSVTLDGVGLWLTYEP